MVLVTETGVGATIANVDSVARLDKGVLSPCVWYPPHLEWPRLFVIPFILDISLIKVTQGCNSVYKVSGRKATWFWLCIR
jgi:hypothetical protein